MFHILAELLRYRSLSLLSFSFLSSLVTLYDLVSCWPAWSELPVKQNFRKIVYQQTIDLAWCQAGLPEQDHLHSEKLSADDMRGRKFTSVMRKILCIECIHS